jgi:hypothetical protein
MIWEIRLRSGCPIVALKLALHSMVKCSQARIDKGSTSGDQSQDWPTWANLLARNNDRTGCKCNLTDIAIRSAAFYLHSKGSRYSDKISRSLDALPAEPENSWQNMVLVTAPDLRHLPRICADLLLDSVSDLGIDKLASSTQSSCQASSARQCSARTETPCAIQL